MIAAFYHVRNGLLKQLHIDVDVVRTPVIVRIGRERGNRDAYSWGIIY
jgi:hypothetical protein